MTPFHRRVASQLLANPTGLIDDVEPNAGSALFFFFSFLLNLLSFKK